MYTGLLRAMYKHIHSSSTPTRLSLSAEWKKARINASDVHPSEVVTINCAVRKPRGHPPLSGTQTVSAEQRTKWWPSNIVLQWRAPWRVFVGGGHSNSFELKILIIKKCTCYRHVQSVVRGLILSLPLCQNPTGSSPVLQQIAFVPKVASYKTSFR